MKVGAVPMEAKGMTRRGSHTKDLREKITHISAHLLILFPGNSCQGVFVMHCMLVWAEDDL